ncbi:UNVERIFIED_CONTAM: hypothetical protein Slati_4133700 [Sesamum latifolium]|uniref:Uncharacterized protein n=1 Tax=Sesamum latifolium TaxID=2727402 RepID=A0AAW2T8C6_9LAMI
MIAGGPAGGDSQRARKAQEEQNGPVIPGNDALVITALLANYEIERVFIDSGSSGDILFGERGCPSKGHDLAFIDLGISPLRKTCLLKFLVVDIPSAYNVILGRPTLNAFRATISTYHKKIKFPVVRGVQARKCYVEAIKRGKKRVLEETSGEENPSKRGKDPMPRPELKVKFL